MVTRSCSESQTPCKGCSAFVVSWSHQNSETLSLLCHHVCDRCCSFPAGTAAAAESCFLNFLLLQRFVVSCHKQLPTSPITWESLSTAKCWPCPGLEGLCGTVTAGWSQLQPCCSAQAHHQIEMVQESSAFCGIGEVSRTDLFAFSCFLTLVTFFSVFFSPLIDSQFERNKTWDSLSLLRPPCAK